MLGCAMLVLGMIGLLGSIIVPKTLASKAQLTQRMTPYDSDTASLTGEIGIPVGEPQLMIIDDPAAFLKGAGPDGAKLANDDYLKANNIYPLQAKTIYFVGGLVRNGTAMATILGLGLFVWTRRTLARRRMIPATT